MVSHDQLVTTAYHEAGHAVASVELGFPYSWAVVVEDGSGYIGPGVRLPRHWGHHFFPHGHERAEDQIVMLASGPLAEERESEQHIDPLRGSLDPRNDWSKVKQRYDVLQPDTDLDALIERSRALIARRWRDVEFVATALVERHRMTSAEVLAEIALAHAGAEPAQESDATTRP
jgi:hypothetical protein